MLLDGVCCEKGENGLMVELHELENVKSPRQKLEILLAVHKVLVDGLSFPSEDGDGHAISQTSSADLLLPVLIYWYCFRCSS